MSPLAQLLNLGPKSAQMLINAGITTPAALRRRGAVAAYVAVKRKNKSASLNLLYALVGALEGMDWKQVQREQKLSLLIQLEDYEHSHPTDPCALTPPP